MMDSQFKQSQDNQGEFKVMKFQMLHGSVLLSMIFSCLSLNGCKQEAAPVGEAIPTANVELPANRGIFAEGSCPTGERVAVPANAAFALYFDSAGEELEAANAEVLAGTQDNQMCAATPKQVGPDPGSCSPKCPVTIGRKTYCVAIPPPCP